jgi:hypothetical protein
MSFYWLKPKGSGFTKIAVGGLDRWPSDWIEIKYVLADVMAKVYREYDVASATLLLERHLPGKKFIGFSSYKLNPFGYKRDFEAYFKVVYSHLTQEIFVDQAVFGFSLSFLTPQYLTMEKGRPYRVPSLVPKMYQGIGEKAKHFLMEPSGLRYVDYARKPRTVYHDLDEKYSLHPQRYEREPRPAIELRGRFEKTLPPQS